MRTIMTFTAIFLALIVFTISYMVCEIQEVVYEKLQNTFTLVSKTIQLIIMTPVIVYF